MQPQLGKLFSNDQETQDLIAIDLKTVQWMKQQVENEIERLKSSGANAIPLPVLNMSVIKEEKSTINRVEMDTAFDFNKIKHILISESIECPYKEGFIYINVLMFTEAVLPLIIPYLYKPPNKLKEWLLINSNGLRAHHHVNSFEKV